MTKALFKIRTESKRAEDPFFVSLKKLVLSENRPHLPRQSSSTTQLSAKLAFQPRSFVLAALYHRLILFKRPCCRQGSVARSSISSISSLGKPGAGSQTDRIVQNSSLCNAILSNGRVTIRRESFLVVYALVDTALKS